MKITNEQQLHPAVYAAVCDPDWYGGHGEVRFRSVTGLLKPAYMAALEDKHQDELTEEAMDRIWSLMGSAMHKVVERGSAQIGVAEQRLSMTIVGETITGGTDLRRQVGKKFGVTDFKFTSVWSYIWATKNRKDGKHSRLDEWEAQVNLYALMYELNDMPVDFGEICLIFRDWSKRESKRNPDYLPASVVLPVNIWPREERLAFAEARVREHKQALEDGGTPCTSEERWQGETKFAVLTGKQKKAVRVLESREEAQSYITEKHVRNARIEVRHGEDVRCQDYCIVRDVCPYYAEHTSPI